MKRLIHFVRGVADELSCGDRDPYLAGILALSVALCTYHLSWGLPNGNFSWAADALGPLSVLSIAKRSLGSFNSGWFWYKYPFGYPLLLLCAYAPYLAFLVLTGGLRSPTMTYPYGFADPERALYVMAMLGRSVNVLLVVGTVALTYGIGRRLADRRVARLAGWFAATAYPLVYYAHTTNQDAAYMFWLALTVWGAIVAIEGDRLWPYIVVGVGAAMAMATKEQGIGLLFALAVVILVARFRAQPASLGPIGRLTASLWARPIGAGLAAVVVATLIGNNALINPKGIVNRFLDLTGHPIAGVSSRLTPIKFALFKGIEKETWYLKQLIDVTESTFGLPVFVLAVVGLAVLARGNRKALACLIWPSALYYFLSLRTHDLLSLRYTLPLVPILAVSAAAAWAAIADRWPRVASPLVLLLCAFSLAQGVELLVLLRTDPRYAAEGWLAKNLPAGASIEYYQKPVYVPRTTGFEGNSVPLDDRTVSKVAERQPAAILMSSAGRKSITHFWNPTWSEGHLLVERPEARAMLDAIETGALPYHLEAKFTQRTWLLRNRINSLLPEIRIYRRTDR